MSAISIRELPDSLVITRPRRNGCLVVFLSVWLTGWTYGLVSFLVDEWSASALSGLVPMALAELFVLGVFVYSIVGKERLTIGRYDVVYEQSAIITFDRCTIPIDGIKRVDLLPLDPTKRKDHAVGVLVITDGDAEIRFGLGLSGAELHELLSHVRTRLTQQNAHIGDTVTAGEVAPISLAEHEEQESHAPPESLPFQIAGWLMVPLVILVGCAFVYGGVQIIATRTLISILFGLLFVGIGLVLSVGLASASLAVFVSWLRRARGGSATSAAGEGKSELRRPVPIRWVPRARGSTDVVGVDERKPWWKMPVEAALFGAAAIVAIVYRFRALPWDEGGTFFQVWITVVGLSILAALPPRLKPIPRTVAALVLVPDLLFVLWGTTRFAVQAMLPFLFLAGFTAATCYMWSRSRFRLAMLLALPLIPVGAEAWFYGLAHVRMVSQLRNLSPRDIEEIEIKDSTRGTVARITDRETLVLIAQALGDTTPYSPNHESISHPRQVTIHLNDGSAMEFAIGKGNSANPKTVWIVFGVEDYQNPSLYPILRAQDMLE